MLKLDISFRSALASLRFDLILADLLYSLTGPPHTCLIVVCLEDTNSCSNGR